MSNYKDVVIKNLQDDQRRLFVLLDDLLLAAATVALHQNPVEDNSEIPNETLNHLAAQVAKTMNSMDYVACKDWCKQGGAE